MGDIIGIDPATEDGDQTVLAVRHEGMTYVCAVPDDLGRITKLENKNGTMVAHTESGVPFIVPWKP